MVGRTNSIRYGRNIYSAFRLNISVLYYDFQGIPLYEIIQQEKELILYILIQRKKLSYALGGGRKNVKCYEIKT